MKWGFTLVELIVSVLVILFLLMLLVPTVNSNREPGPSNLCKHNEHNLALALAQFEANHGAIPGYTQKLAGNDASWCVVILPGLERNELWLDWNAGTPTKKVVKVICLPLFLSPAVSAPVVAAGKIPIMAVAA